MTRGVTDSSGLHQCGARAPSRGSVSYRLMEMGDLAEGQITRWREMRAANRALASPYYHPAFAAAVAATRPSVKVIVGEDAQGAVQSFLPVQFDKRICRPAGAPAADFQGPVCEPEADFDLAAAVTACGVAAYEFDHMRTGVPGAEPWAFGHERAPYIDVTGGIAEYLGRASRSGKDHLAQARRDGRKAVREYGPLRFVADSGDANLLDAVIALKRRQSAARGFGDYFSDAPHRQLVHRLLREADGAEFGGMLSAIYAGPHLLAAHFGLRSGPVLHWWFPVYEPAFARLAPGWLLLRHVIAAAPHLGLTRIDLGRGNEEYKRWLMTGYEVVSQGAVVCTPWRRRAASGRRRVMSAITSSSAGPILRSAVRYVRRRSR